MTRYRCWLAIGVGAEFLVVASAAFSAPDAAALAFAISIATLVVSAGIAYIRPRFRRVGVDGFSGCSDQCVDDRRQPRVLATTAQHLELASSLADQRSGSRRPDDARALARARHAAGGGQLIGDGHQT